MESEVVAAPPEVRSPDLPPAVAAPATRPTRAYALPGDWSALAPREFEALLAGFPRDGTVTLFSDADLSALGEALRPGDATSVRAATLLAATRDPRAFEVLMRRLEARLPEGTRDLAGDVVAAAATASVLPAPEAAARIEALAGGPAPHPALLVRVECALTSLALGRDGVIPFLLDFLREGTAQAVRRPTWRRIDWNDERQLRTQDRVARALCARAGVECRYRARGPLAVREAEIARLADILAALGAPGASR